MSLHRRFRVLSAENCVAPSFVSMVCSLLTKSGLRYNEFHTTALCSPTKPQGQNTCTGNGLGFGAERRYYFESNAERLAQRLRQSPLDLITSATTEQPTQEQVTAEPKNQDRNGVSKEAWGIVKDVWV
jgi:hypothetical protein